MDVYTCRCSDCALPRLCWFVTSSPRLEGSLTLAGAQEILYFTGGALSFIQVSIHTTVPNWLLTANTLAVTAICPFVGYITDLLGRRWICILGSLLLVVGSIVMGVTSSLASAVTGQAIAGIGAGVSNHDYFLTLETADKTLTDL